MIQEMTHEYPFFISNKWIIRRGYCMDTLIHRDRPLRVRLSEGLYSVGSNFGNFRLIFEREFVGRTWQRKDLVEVMNGLRRMEFRAGCNVWSDWKRSPSLATTGPVLAQLYTA